MTAQRNSLSQTEPQGESPAFYEGLLGLHKIMAEHNLTGLEAGAFQLFFHRDTPLGPMLELHVPSLARARSAMLAAGCRVEAEDPAILRCHLRDPFGLPISLAEQAAA